MTLYYNCIGIKDCQDELPLLIHHVYSSLHSCIIIYLFLATVQWHFVLTDSLLSDRNMSSDFSCSLPPWQFIEATFRQSFCLFLHDMLENEGLIVSFQQQPHRVRMR